MDEADLIEDILTTKNTLTILHRVFIVNQTILEPFSPIFDLITELLNILSHASATQIKTVLLSNGSESLFKKVKETLNELSDAITTKNTSVINRLNEQLSFCAQKLRICSSNVVNNEETADDIFKKQLLQSHIDVKDRFQSERAASPEIPISDPEDNVDLSSSSSSKLKETQEKSPIVDHFAQFRFARRQRSPIASEEDEESFACAPPSSSLPKSSTAKPRLMISYNHESKSLCLDIYKSLINDGYNIWIDFKQMHGSILVAMAQGIDNSDIILYCVTEKYSQSLNCQKEAEYAFVQEKIMIPLMLQSKYKPKGWLGLLLGASLYIDFTKNDFTNNYEQLKREIQANTMRISGNTNEVAKLTSDLTTNDNEQTHNVDPSPPIQSTKTNSVAIEIKSRSCVLF